MRSEDAKNERSTVGGKTGRELMAEHQEALRNMTPEELAASLDGLVERQRELLPQLIEEADWRKEMRRRQN